MQKIFGIDISDHRPRDVAGLFLAEYDHIVALDQYVSEHLSKYPQIKIDRLTVWNIKDPFIEGTAEAYEYCARDLEKRIQSLVNLNIPTSFVCKEIQSISENNKNKAFDQQLNELRANVRRWLKEIDEGKIRGTLLHGMGIMAARDFEVLLRGVLRLYINRLSDDETDILGPDKVAKGIDKLTMGEVKECIEKNDHRITKFLKQHSDSAAISLKNRRLFNNSIKKKLDRIISLRNNLAHRSVVSSLGPLTYQLLTLIEAVLYDIFFELIVEFNAGNDGMNQ